MVREWGCHPRRVWSVDYAPTGSGMFATGSDDGRVKVTRRRVHAALPVLGRQRRYGRLPLAPSPPIHSLLWTFVLPAHMHEVAAMLSTPPTHTVTTHSHLFLTPQVWSEAAPASSLALEVRANVCSVQFNPSSPHLLAVGSAGHAVLIYDLRRPAEPQQVLAGHTKAVAYVRWMDGHQLVSASTDNSLRLWEVGGGAANAAAGSIAGTATPPLPRSRAYQGHTNERNFVGLSCEGPFIACGSETHEVFVYHRDMPSPCVRRCLAAAGEGAQPPPAAAPPRGPGSQPPRQQPFVSAVCWRRNSSSLLAANSQGSIALLALTL